MAQARSFLESERSRIFYFVCFCAFADDDFGSAFSDFRKVLVFKKNSYCSPTKIAYSLFYALKMCWVHQECQFSSGKMSKLQQPPLGEITF